MRSLSEIPETRRIKAEYWFSVCAGWEKSKLSKLSYCKQNRICPSTFYYWSKYLQGKSDSPYSSTITQRKTTAKNKQPAFLPVTVKKEPAVVTNDVGSSGLELVLSNSLTLRIEKTFDPASLVKVVTALRTLC